MKIGNDALPPLATQINESKTDAAAEKSQAQAAPQKALQKPRSADKVDLSPALTQGNLTHQELQAKKVESIKARIEAGTYQVDSRKVAEKMLADPYGF